MSGERVFHVSARHSGRPLEQVLRAYLKGSWSEIRQAIAQGQVRINGNICRNALHRVTRGLRLQIQPVPPTPRQATGRKPAGSDAALHHAVRLRHVDGQVVVVDKPAGLTTMRHEHEAAEFGRRGRRFLPPTLADLLPDLIAPNARRKQAVFAVHRLDKDTSGLVVFARTRHAEANLGRQFRAHTIGRRYLAIVRGRAQSGCIESYIARDRGDGRRGSTTNPANGQRAVTHVHVLEDLGDFTFVECRLETGRTHQVRIHLGESGTPICGERIYDRPIHGAPLPDASQTPRLALHAAEVAFTHPTTGERLAWKSPLPEDLKGLLVRLRIRHRESKDARG